MRFGHIEIFVTDPMVSKEFYVGQLGFDLDQVQDGRFVWLVSNGISLLLRAGRSAEEAGTYQDAASALVFYTDRLEETVARLEANGVPMKGRDGSSSCYTFTDPDGNWLQLVDPERHE